MLDSSQDMFYKLFALFILFFSVLVIVMGIITIHELPYKIAKSRNHAQQDAIRCMSVMGLLLFPLWLLAMIWAYTRPVKFNVTGSDELDGKDITLDGHKPDNTDVPVQASEQTKTGGKK